MSKDRNRLAFNKECSCGLIKYRITVSHPGPLHEVWTYLVCAVCDLISERKRPTNG